MFLILFLFSVQRWSSRITPYSHHLGGNCHFPCLPGYMHLHLLLFPWSAEWPQYYSQEPLYQPFHCGIYFPNRHWQDEIHGKHPFSLSPLDLWQLLYQLWIHTRCLYRYLFDLVTIKLIMVILADNL